jgi:O-antigen/teichoic acid export membrane protein
MIRDFLKEGTVYTLAGFLAKGVSLMLIPLFTRYFSPTDFGVLDLLYVFSMFFIAVFSFQIGQGMTRFIGETGISYARKKHIASTGLLFVCAMLITGSLVVILFRNFFLTELNLTHPSYEKTFLLAVASIVLNGLYAFFGSHLLALRRKGSYALSSFLHSLLGIIATYIFVIVWEKSINGVFYATIAIVPFVLVIQFYQLRDQYKLLFSVNLIKPLLHYSLPLIPAAIAFVVLSLTDRICISYMLGKSQLGVYSVGFKFSFGLSLLISGFALALNPLIFQRHKEPDTPGQLTKLLNGYIIVGLGAVALLTLFSKETVVWFTQKPYYEAATVMPWVYLSVWFSGLLMFSPGMNIFHKNGLIPLVTITCAGLNILLNIWLIPKFGIQGAGIATLLSSALNYLGLFYISGKLYPIPFSAKTGALGLVLITGLILGITTINQFNHLILVKAMIGLLAIGSASWWIIKKVPRIMN